MPHPVTHPVNNVMLHYEKLYEGQHRSNRGKLTHVFSRDIIAKFYFAKNVGSVGKTLVVMGTHVNNNVAKNAPGFNMAFDINFPLEAIHKPRGQFFGNIRPTLLLLRGHFYLI